MLISGLQKLSLVDWPGRVVCTVFTGGCPLRCPYCHNSELIAHPPKLMEPADFLAWLKGRAGLLDGVCVTGGEPCIHPDLPDFLLKIKALGFGVKLDTNGFQPEMVRRVLEARAADYIAMDIKNSPEKYPETVGVDICGVGPVLESASLLMASGIDFELRTTVALPFHSLTSFTGIRAMLTPVVEKAGRKLPHYYLQSFVDRESVAFAGIQAPSDEQLKHFAAALAPIVAEDVRIRGR